MSSTYSRMPVAAIGGHGRATGLCEWEHTMRLGVSAAREGNTVLAEGLYLQALSLSQALLAGDADAAAMRPDDCVAAFVVSQLNLADLHSDARRIGAAAAHLCAAHCKLVALLRDPDIAPALQESACRHSRETHAALLAHVSQHGERPDTMAALHAAITLSSPPHPTLH